MEFSPDYIQTNIQQFGYFKFFLPAIAFGIVDKSMILEISVEYSSVPIEETYRADVWARQKDAKTKHFIYPVVVAVSREPEMSITSAINEDETFYQLMRGFLYEAAKHRCD